MSWPVEMGWPKLRCVLGVNLGIRPQMISRGMIQAKSRLPPALKHAFRFIRLMHANLRIHCMYLMM